MEKRTSINKELKAKYDALRNECGGSFHMVIAYVMDKGFSAVSEITDEDIKSMVARLEKKENELKERGKFSLMTPEFQGWLVTKAVQLVKIGKSMDLLKYITNEVFIG